MNIERLLGFICGVGVSVLLIWALMRRFNTDGRRKTEYDERQKVTRGIGYMYAFYVLAGWTVILIAVDMLEAAIDSYLGIENLSKALRNGKERKSNK